MGSVNENTKAGTGKSYTPYSLLCGNTKVLRYKSVIDPFLYRELESMNGQHPRVLPIAHNLLNFFSEVITDSGASLPDLILTEAITEWSQRALSQGYTPAFKAFCKVILLKLPLVFELRISGIRKNYPNPVVVWNPLKEGLVSWLDNNKVLNLKIERVNNDTCFSQRELALMVACHVFEQADLFLFGFGDIYSQEAISEIEVKRMAINDDASNESVEVSE